MKRIMLSYFDKKLGIYSEPFSVAEASIEDIIEQTRRMCANPQCPDVYFEYELYKLGEFDDKLGSIVSMEHPDFIVSLGDFRYLKEVKENVKES